MHTNQREFKENNNQFLWFISVHQRKSAAKRLLVVALLRSATLWLLFQVK